MSGREIEPDEAARRRRDGWSVGSEIDWGSIDVAQSRLDTELLALTRRAALRAARRTVGLSALLSLLSDDAQASALLSTHLHDGWKHFHAMRSYLDAVEFSPALSDEELARELRETSVRTARPVEVAALLGDLVDEATRDGALFSLIASQANEVALTRLASRIGRDRHAHALAYSSLMTRSASPSTFSARIA